MTNVPQANPWWGIRIVVGNVGDNPEILSHDQFSYVFPYLARKWHRSNARCDLGKWAFKVVSAHLTGNAAKAPVQRNANFRTFWSCRLFSLAKVPVVPFQSYGVQLARHPQRNDCQREITQHTQASIQCLEGIVKESA
jgi:hypothetical protein